MNRRSPLTVYLAVAFAVILTIAAADLLAGAFSIPAPVSQNQSRPKPNDANPFNVQFRDVTRESGIRFRHERAASPQRLYLETMGAGVAWIDYNQDGYLDAFFVNSGFTPFFHPAQAPQPALYRNNGDGTFTDVTASSKIHSDGTFFFGVAVADYDNDGFPDIYMTGYRHSVLLHNNGDGTFTDVTAKAGVGDDGNWATAAAWFDYDRDGKLDLLVTNYVKYDVDHPVLCGDTRQGLRDLPHSSAYCHPDNFPGTSMRLYHNNGDGTFTDVTEKAGLVNNDGKSLAVVTADLNNDGWPDIFIANDTQRNFLYFNNGDGTFRDASFTSGAGFSEDGRPEAGMSADAADVMNNGLPDLFVSHLDHELNRFYRNNGDATFTDATISSGIGRSSFLNSAFGARFFDFDNDGWRDLLVINGHILDNVALYHSDVKYEEEKKLYRNVGKGIFVDATKTQGVDFRAPHVGRGLAVGDYDNDGYLDFLVSNNGEPAQLFHNDAGGASRQGTVSTVPKSPATTAASAAEGSSPTLTFVSAGLPSSASSAVAGSVAGSAEFQPRRNGASRQGTVSTVPKSPATTAASAAEVGSKEVPGAPPFASQKGGSSTSDSPPTSSSSAPSSTPSADAGRAGFQPRRNAASSAGASAPEVEPYKNHWFAVRLIGTKSNRDAIGASLKLTADDFVSYDQSKGGMSYCSAQDPRIYFGLGARDHVDALEIRWPSGATEIFKDLAADQILTITEGAGVQPNKFPRARPR